MAEQASEAAVLFADISGSTKLYESAGNAIAHAAVENCVNLMRQKTEAAKGRVVKTIGDEVMAIFPRADDAADAAIEMQLAVSALPPVGETALGIRVGFDYGAVLERDGEFFGDAVSLASRLVGVATKGQIITARDTVMLMSPMLKACTRAITTIQVQGKAQEIQAFELLWQQSEDMTTLASHKSAFKPRHTTLRLKVQGTELVLSAERPTLAMGRDPSADLVINERMASRAHGKIERRLDKFILTDHSANGTFVTIEGDKEIVLRREEFTLRGHGWIAFGQSRAGATDVIEFICE
jgi:adenylate cyclase